jgi:hypothetical protein
MSQDRVASVPLVWPTTLVRPARAKAVYLDLNHFINLAKYAHGHRAFRHYAGLMSAVLRAQADGRALFPLSTVHYIEMAGIPDLGRRGDVAEVMEAVTQFASLLDRPTLVGLELRETIRARLGMPLSGHRYELLGTGVLRAFGKVGGLRVYDDAGEDVTDAARNLAPDPIEFDRRFAKAERDLDRAALSGVLAAEYGSQPPVLASAKAELAVASQSRLDFETDFIEILQDPQHRQFRRERLRDAVGARELTHEWLDAFNAELHAVGASIEDVMGGSRENAIAFAESMPSTRVAISMKTSYHRNPQRTWSMNDIHDIDAASAAVAYCDAVFTDKHVWNAVTSARELQPMRTFMPRNPEQLAEWLDQIP